MPARITNRTQSTLPAIVPMSYPKSAAIVLNQKSLSREILSLSPEAHSTIFVRIADITMALQIDDRSLALQSAGSVEKFLVDRAEADVRVRAGWGDLSREKPGKRTFDSGGVWQLSIEDGAYRFFFFSPLLGPVPYKVASFNLDFSLGTVTLHRPYFAAGSAAYPLQYPLDELMLMHLLARGRGAEVHACGVVDDLGNGHLFIGQSGAGKTTMARLWEKRENIAILSDDRVVLREMDNRIWMYGTPWHGEAGLAEASRAPLTRVYFLRHGDKNALVPQTPTAAVSRLLACGFPPFYSAEALNFTLHFFEQVANAVPCDEIRFVPDERVVRFISENIGLN